MRPGLERALWGCTVTLALTAGFAWAAATPAPLPDRDDLPALPSLAGPVDGDSLDEQALRVVARDLFRLDRVPSLVPYEGLASATSNAMPAVVPRPELTLTGVLGPPWRAVLEGVPGREAGVLVAVGDTLAGIRVHAIRPEAVVLRAPDTSWTLTLRRTW